MAITSADIHNQSFSIDRKGYDVDEVDVFLEHVANEIDELHAIIEQLETELDNAGFAAADAQAQQASQASKAESARADAELAKKSSRIADLERQLEDKKANDYAIAQALIIAQRSADEMVSDAQVQAGHIVDDAKDEAKRIVDKATRDKQLVIDEIDRLEEEREDARGEYQTILKDFISDASKKLSDLGATNIPAPASPAKATKTERPKAKAPASRAAAAKPYATPSARSTSASSAAVPAAPKPSKVEKDLSGFGDAAAFELGEVD
ncbi:MAG: DivIVA domain-containing protein [Coriobacteriaceae bacterium]|jgi:DivIVA domain-containing protein|nr:DivIVA domain-containing protein [Coriobacteriaceae bacterium]